MAHHQVIAAVFEAIRHVERVVHGDEIAFAVLFVAHERVRLALRIEQFDLAYASLNAAVSAMYDAACRRIACVFDQTQQGPRIGLPFDAPRVAVQIIELVEP
ncbi:hypothetical protein AWB73_06889 [Caballeronia turbans]|nr:hypothetical protein AWB73_06889 [Caballeronia turbans]